MSFRILIVGLGSIGRRHARLLKNHFGIEADALRLSGQSRSEVSEHISKSYSHWSEIKENTYDIGIISNPTHEHIETAIQCAKRGMHLFIEKPLGTSLAKLPTLQQEIEANKLSVYVAYPLRFHPVIARLKSLVNDASNVNYVIRSLSYLPDWRPGRSKDSVYSCYKEMGGGVLLDLSHEIDYLDFLSSGVTKIAGTLSKEGNVTFDSEDTAFLKIDHAQGKAKIALSYLQREPERSITASTDQTVYKADLLNNQIESGLGEKKSVERFNVTMDEVYVNQFHYFFDNLGKRELSERWRNSRELFHKIINFRENNEYFSDCLRT